MAKKPAQPTDSKSSGASSPTAPSTPKKPGANGPTARQQLKGLVERITRLEEEKKALADDIKDIYKEAKSNGFDPKALRKIVKESQQTQGQRAAARETEAITDIYRANLGMLDGTPLGDAARKKFEEEMARAAKKAREEDEDAESAGEDASGAEDKPPEDTEEQAREKGREAHAAGAKITQNPYPAGSRNRAAWDEAWCEADGSDGMDVPDAWRRAPKEEEEPEGEDA